MMKRILARFSPSRRRLCGRRDVSTPFSKSMFCWVFVLSALLTLPGQTQAIVMTEANMSANNLRFSSPDPLVDLIWTLEWQGVVHAQAQDTDSGTDADDASIISDNAALAVFASTAFVNSSAGYRVVNGPEVAKGGGEVEVTSHSDLEIFDPGKQGSGEAAATFDNPFVVIGGNPGDPVEVTFELDFDYEIAGHADSLGFFDVFVEALFQIEDFDDLGLRDIDTVDDIVDDLFFRHEFGSNRWFEESGNGTLVVTALLEFEKEYFLFGEVDSEVFGFNHPIPEPGTLVLMGWGLGIVAWRCRKRSTSLPKHP